MHEHEITRFQAILFILLGIGIAFVAMQVSVFAVTIGILLFYGEGFLPAVFNALAEIQTAGVWLSAGVFLLLNGLLISLIGRMNRHLRMGLLIGFIFVVPLLWPFVQSSAFPQTSLSERQEQQDAEKQNESREESATVENTAGTTSSAHASVASSSTSVMHVSSTSTSDDATLLLQARREGNYELCERIHRMDYRSYCWNSAAVTDLAACINIGTSITIGLTVSTPTCVKDIAMVLGEPELCDNFTDEYWKMDCYNSVARAIQRKQEYLQKEALSLQGERSFCEGSEDNPPIHPSYQHLSSLGALFTARACGSQRMADLFGSTYVRGSTITLSYAPPAPSFAPLRANLLQSGYICTQAAPEDSCTSWVLEDDAPLVPLLNLEPFVDLIASEDCVHCDEPIARAQPAICMEEPEMTAIGSAQYPVSPEYAHLPFLGQIFTADTYCSAERIEEIDGVEDGLYRLGSTIWLQEPPSSELITTLRSIGFSCDDDVPDTQCTDWKNWHVIRVTDLLKLEPYHERFQGDDCLQCG